jgi:hypothetical protein
VGVVAIVETVSVLVAPTNVGVTDAGLNEQEAPAGRVAATQDKVTDWAVPATRVRVILLVLELPCWTLIPPEFASE